MTATEFEEAKLLWKSFYASHSFGQARTAAQHIFDNMLEKDDLLFHPLLVATYTLYAKPFTRSDGVGRLEETIVPKEHLEQHQLMLEHRHQIYAHRDADGFQVDEYGVVNQVRAVRTREVMGLMGTEFHARYMAMPAIITLCENLKEKTDYTVMKLWNRHKGKVPKKVGEYFLNVLDAKTDLWLPKKPMVFVGS